jgi:hypothetical protein
MTAPMVKRRRHRHDGDKRKGCYVLEFPGLDPRER